MRTSLRALAAAVLLACVACGGIDAAGRADEVLGAAAEHKRRGRLAEALAHYEAVLVAEPQNVDALRGLVEVHHRLGRLDPLKTRFSTAIEKAPGDAYAHAGLGLVHAALGGSSGPKAVEELSLAVKFAPKVADFPFRLGVVLLESDEEARAREALARAVELDPRRARYRLPYATALARTGDRAGALVQLAAVLALSPTRDEVQLGEKSARLLVDPFRGFPQPAREQYELALGWLQGDGAAQAQQALDLLLERFPELAILHATSGLCALRANDTGRAIASFRRAAELDPGLADPHEYLGDLYFGRGRPDTAREYFEAALQRNPYLPGPRRRLADVHLKEGRKSEAAAAFGTYLLLRPDDFEAHVAYATLLGELDRAEAGAAWDALVARFPRRADALIGAARYAFVRAAKSQKAEDRAAQKEKARVALEAAVAVDPENAVASQMLAQLARLP